MTYDNHTFGASNEYNAKTPSVNTIYVFSPYYVEVTGTAANQIVTATVGSNSVSRRTNASFKCKIPISELFVTLFKDVSLGDIEQWDVGVDYYNTSSKLIIGNVSIVIKIGTDTNTFTDSYDVSWGAIQLGEIQETSIEIYVFRKYVSSAYVYLPCTITDKRDDKDLWVSELIASGYPPSVPYPVLDDEGVWINYTFKVIDYCGDDNTYLRWVAPTGEYKYFLFSPLEETDDIQSNPIARQQVWGLDQTESGAFGHIKTDERNKNRNINPIVECGIPNATYNQQVHLRTLERSLMQWYWNGSTWVECRIEMDAIKLDRFKQAKEVTVRVIKPKLYIQTL